MTPNPWMLLLMVVLGAACMYLASVRGVAEDIERPAGEPPREPVREPVPDREADPVVAEERPAGVVDRLRGGATAATTRLRGLFRRDREPAEAAEGDNDDDAPASAAGRTTMIFAPRLAADAKNAQRPEPVDADPLATDDVPDAPPTPYAADPRDTATTENHWRDAPCADDSLAEPGPARPADRALTEPAVHGDTRDAMDAEEPVDTADIVDTDDDPFTPPPPAGTPARVGDVATGTTTEHESSPPTRATDRTDPTPDDHWYDDEFTLDEDESPAPAHDPYPTDAGRGDDEDLVRPGVRAAPDRSAGGVPAEPAWDDEFDDEPRPLRVPTDVPAPVDDELAAPPAAEPHHPHPVRLPAPEADLTGEPDEPDAPDMDDMDGTDGTVAEPAPPRTPRRATSPATTPRRPEPLFVEGDEDDDVMDLVEVVDIEPAPYPRYQAVPPRPAASPHRQNRRPDPADTLFDDDPR